MTHWRTFDEKDEFEPDIVVGMYDRWLSQLGHGPTQAERVLVHTPMMEVAHERRFVAAETKCSLSDFKFEHTLRIEQTIDLLQSHFAKYRAIDADCATAHQPTALIGLAPLPTESVFHRSFLGANRLLDTATPPIEQVLEDLSSGRPVEQGLSTASQQFGMDLAVEDCDDISDGNYEQSIEEVRIVSKQLRQISNKRPRQRKPIRIHKDVATFHGDESDGDSRPLAKRARA